MSEYDYPMHAEADHRSAQVIQIEQGKSVSTIALVLSVGALIGLFLMAIMVSGLIESKAKEAAAVAVVRSGQAQQDVALAKHDIQTIQRELKKRGIDIPVN
jgi:hypothetical protein